MASRTSRIPEGFHTITPHLVVRNAAEAVDFYKKAFGAEVHVQMPGPSGQGIMHAELQIGNSRFMLADENPQWGVRSPLTLGGSPVGIHLYVEDADAAFARAIKAGATETMPLKNQFWGDRFGQLRDPYGHDWSIASHVEDVPPAEMKKRAAEAFAGGCCEK